MSDPLREGDVVGRFRAGLLVDTGTILEVNQPEGGTRPEKILWGRGIEHETGDDIRRVLM
jgi:hypothetical protein